MKQIRILLILLFNILLVFSCSSPEGKEVKNIPNVKQDSIHYEYYDNDIVKSKSLFQSGERHGLYESYWKNGNVFGKVTYENGLRRGFYENFDSISQKITTRVEYIKDPSEPVGVSDFANRIWYYKDGDTLQILKSSTTYNITQDSLNSGIEGVFYFSNEDEAIDSFSVIFLTLEKSSTANKEFYEYLNNPDTTIEIALTTDKREYFAYTFSEKDIEKEFVEGAIAAHYSKVVDGEQKFSSRLLYFRWNIKEAKLENHLFGN